jgi:hypothetical protein
MGLRLVGDLGVGGGEEMGLEVGLEEGEGLGVTDMLGEGVPEPGSCPGEGSVAKAAEFCVMCYR